MRAVAADREITFGSLFAGVGGFDAGFEAAGLRCLWQVEIEKDCRSVLTRHYPHAERFNDVAEVGGHNLTHVDVICGGFPCQDLSVAGKRAGLSGGRSGLFYQMVRVVDEIRPMFLVWENVPGLLSSDDGRDFARVLRALDDIGYSGGWTGFDAQWFGVAQRRRRIFGVFAPRDIGAGSCAEILSLRESLRRNPPTRRETRERIAATVTPRIDGNSKGWSPINEADNLIAATLNSEGNAGGFRTEPGEHIVTHTLKAEGHDASEDGTGRGVPIVPDGRQFGTGRDAQDTFVVQAFTQNTRDEVRLIGGDGSITGALGSELGMKQQNYIAFDTTQITSKGNYSNPQPNAPCHPLASEGHPPAIAFDWQSGGDVRLNCSDEYTSALQTNQTPAISFRGNPTTDVFNNQSGAVTTDSGSGNRLNVLHCGVRRLTPRECERLQGFRDDWTRYDENGKEISDSARYRMLGNAVCVKNARWIGGRIQKFIAAYLQLLPIAVNE